MIETWYLMVQIYVFIQVKGPLAVSMRGETGKKPRNRSRLL